MSLESQVKLLLKEVHMHGDIDCFDVLHAAADEHGKRCLLTLKQAKAVKQGKRKLLVVAPQDYDTVRVFDKSSDEFDSDEDDQQDEVTQDILSVGNFHETPAMSGFAYSGGGWFVVNPHLVAYLKKQLADLTPSKPQKTNKPEKPHRASQLRKKRTLRNTNKPRKPRKPIDKPRRTPTQQSKRRKQSKKNKPKTRSNRSNRSKASKKVRARV